MFSLVDVTHLIKNTATTSLVLINEFSLRADVLWTPSTRLNRRGVSPLNPPPPPPRAPAESAVDTANTATGGLAKQTRAHKL